jgi:hypothetical protein
LNVPRDVDMKQAYTLHACDNHLALNINIIMMSRLNP